MQYIVQTARFPSIFRKKASLIYQRDLDIELKTLLSFPFFIIELFVSAAQTVLKSLALGLPFVVTDRNGQPERQSFLFVCLGESPLYFIRKALCVLYVLRMNDKGELVAAVAAYERLLTH